ncbi:MAG: LptF/LptG family permease [Paludibacter sp.]|nr:LptF/LptG family permease [Bacteroidales bacterium]MCM1069394.1 LptF/LptG family permease [Prevotella sp.]MCM1353914.1 LptF/LptG family permease [Bacteroides sp.]MCM1442836.1 LptF/LptG family permease [Muribaculum sp.]MCM1481881.1 LptF/LptG family permease [Paludibacter sp.]
MILCMKKLDWYIIKKFLGTFFFSIVLILSIAIVFDLTEKMDTFYDPQVPLREIIFDYYFNFIPYYMNMFSPLFIFISVIFFTSKLAGNSEIIAILASGVSFRRLMWPYFFSALLLFGLSFWLGGYIIPPASGKMLAFQDKYIQKFKSENARNIQMEVEPGTILYIESFQMRTRSGYRASLEHFEGKTLTTRITADRIKHDSAYNWHLEKYIRRDFEGMREEVSKGARLDTVIPMLPEELFITAEEAQQMTNPELWRYIQKQRQRGTGNLQAFETEWWKRFASPVGAFVMTLLGVSLSSRKVRGGMGKNLGVGLTLSALYILFSTVSTTFSVSGVMSPFMSVWLPDFLFLAIGIFLYTRTPK